MDPVEPSPPTRQRQRLDVTPQYAAGAQATGLRSIGRDRPSLFPGLFPLRRRAALPIGSTGTRSPPTGVGGFDCKQGSQYQTRDGKVQLQ